MEINKFYLHPFIRLSFLISGIAGSILVNQTCWLLACYVLYILPLFLFNGQIKKHINLIIFGMVPVFLSFILLYIVALKSSNGDWSFIYFKMLKLILFTSIFQLTFSIPSENLISTFKMWRLKGEALITVLGAFTVWADVNYRAGKIITARFSRGFIGKRTPISKAKQFPHVLVPLVIGILRTSTERAKSWEQKNILYLVEVNKSGKTNYPVLLNGIILTVSILWLLIAILTK